MANQTVTTAVVNYDDAAISGLSDDLTHPEGRR